MKETERKLARRMRTDKFFVFVYALVAVMFILQFVIIFSI